MFTRIPRVYPESCVKEEPSSPGQSRVGSLVEVLVNVGLGFGVAFASQLIIFPFFGIDIPLSSNLYIVMWFTAISVARGYIVRRWFDKKIKSLSKSLSDHIK